MANKACLDAQQGTPRLKTTRASLANSARFVAFFNASKSDRWKGKYQDCLHFEWRNNTQKSPHSDYIYFTQKYAEIAEVHSDDI